MHQSSNTIRKSRQFKRLFLVESREERIPAFAIWNSSFTINRFLFPAVDGKPLTASLNTVPGNPVQHHAVAMIKRINAQPGVVFSFLISLEIAESLQPGVGLGPPEVFTGCLKAAQACTLELSYQFVTMFMQLSPRLTGTTILQLVNKVKLSFSVSVNGNLLRNHGVVNGTDRNSSLSRWPFHLAPNLVVKERWSPGPVLPEIKQNQFLTD